MGAGRLIYPLVIASQAARLARRLAGAPIFCFHNVLARQTGCGDRLLHMDVARFEACIDWIDATYEVVPLAELERRRSQRRTLAGLAAITFDDAYQGVFDFALPVLRRRQLPATIFVVSGAADRPDFFWWDLVAGEQPLDPAARDRFLDELAGDRDAVLRAAPPAVQLPARAFLPAPWEVILAAGGGIEIGSHTITHRNLAVLPAADLEREMAGSRRALAERIGRLPDAIAYPYGHHSAAVLETAARAGYATGVILSHRTLRPADDRLAVPRINVPANILLPTLECWAAGLNFDR